MVKRLILAIILLGLIVGGVVGFNMFRDKMIAQFFAGRKPDPVVVSVTDVKPATWTPGIEAIGTAIAAQGVDLSVEAAGVVKAILFTPNERVEGGVQLVQIDDRTEQADLNAAKSALTLAQSELTRTRELKDRGVSTLNTLDVAEATAIQAESEVNKLIAVLEQKRSVAPFGGVIGIPKIEVGQFVTAGTVYATLQDLDNMRVDFSLPEQQAQLATIGAPVSVTSEVGDLNARGKIVGVEPKIDPNSRLVVVRAEVENIAGKLTPGQFLRVRVELPEEPGVIALPQTVVSSNLYGDSVFAVRPAAEEGGNETVEQVFVRLGRRVDGMVEVVSGLKDGDRVVTAGQNRLFPNAPVVIDNTVSPVPAAAQSE